MITEHVYAAILALLICMSRQTLHEWFNVHATIDTTQRPLTKVQIRFQLAGFCVICIVLSKQ